MYKHGAKAPSILKHTINGLMGLIIKKPMTFITAEDDIYDNRTVNTTSEEVEETEEVLK